MNIFSNIRKVIVTSITIFFILFSLFFVKIEVSAAPPPITGNVPVDFAGQVGVTKIGDFAGDVGFIAGDVSGTPGWDVRNIYMWYDKAADKMYVGIECAGKCGDADGNGDPSTTGAPLNGAGGTDFDWNGSEWAGFYLDLNNSATQGNGGWDVAIGNGTLSNVAGLGNDWKIYNGNAGDTTPNGNVNSPALTAYVGTATSSILSTNTGPTSNDIEFVINNYSALPGYTAGTFPHIFWGNGSVGDAGVGEDYSESQPVKISGHVRADTNGDGVGDACIGGVTLTLVDGSGNPVLVSTVNGPTSITTTTGATGPAFDPCYYEFPYLPTNTIFNLASIPSEYGIQETQPANFVSVSETAGTGADGFGISHNGTAIVHNQILHLVLNNGNVSVNNDFVEEKPTITVNKTVVNDNGGTATAANFQMKLNGTNVAQGAASAALTTSSNTITETGPAGYSQSSITCTANATGAAVTYPVVFSDTATNDDVTCLVTNDDTPGTITVNKTVVNNSGGTKVVSDFPLTVGGTSVTSGTVNTLNAGTYLVAETQQTGYTQTSLVCTDNSNAGVVANPVVLSLGQSVTCAITNDDDSAHITVIKTVTNSNGGSKIATDFALTINGNPVTTNVINTVNAGTYTVAETLLPGYSQSSFVCKDDSTGGVIANPVVLALGQSVTCNILNVDLPATIKVNKVVINDNGGTKVIADFPLALNGTAVTSGVVNTKTPGTYTVTETNQTGYTQSSIACVNAAGATVAHPVVLSIGDAITCTVTNDDNPAHLTVTKVVNNTHGGTLTTSSFPLMVNGAGVTSGVSNTESVGLYTVSETQQTGYTQVSLVCIDNATGGSIGTANGQTKDVTLALGQDVTCTVTNADLPVKLTVTKKVINDNGGGLVVGSFSLTDNAGAVTSGVQNTVSAGIHTIAETAVAGYTQVSTVCVDDNTNAVQVFPYNFALGQSVTCTITNDDQPAHLTVTKVVVNDSGGAATVASFPLKIGATTVTSGTSNTENVGTYTVSETQQTGYTQTSFVCIDNATGGSVGVVNAGNAQAKDVTLALNQSVTCTITNDDNPGHITVIKSVTNSNGGGLTATSFPLLLNGNSVTTNTINTVNAGTYTVTETQQPGYIQTSLTCKDDSSGANVVHPVVLSLGQSVTCTVANADIPAKITVNKVVVNNSGGSKVISDFPLLLGGTAVTSGVSNTKIPGTYLVSETPVAGYTQTSIACVNDVGGATVANPVVLALGMSVTCTVTNDDIPAHLTVTKVVNNTHGGGLGVANFPLLSNGTAITSGTNNTVNAGTYTVSETQQAGYVQTSIICKDDNSGATVTNPVVLALAQSVTCTITNADVPAQLTITKVVVNDNGGTATAGNFTLTDNATTVTSGAKNPVSAGIHTVAETNITGYTQTSLVCKDDTTNANVAVPPNLALGQSVTCTFTNDDVAPLITVTKVVTNNNGGTKVISDFPLKVGATSVTSGVQKSISAGTYNITETGSPDYLATYSGDCNASGAITLAVGDVKVCTITNNDYPNLGDYVWADTDKNGVQDVADNGINGITVNLYCSGSTTKLLTTTTGNNPVGGKPGYYQFLHLDPAKCNYVVEFVKPSGSVFTLKDISTTTDLLDSDADLTTGKTVPITMIMDQDQEFWDAGIFTPASIGDTVWTDANADGIQDVSETGTTCSTGVTVKLTDHLGASVKDADGIIVSSQVTTNTGKYLFTNLLPGKYIVTFTPAANSGCVFTTKDNASTTDLLDSDADATTGATTIITILPGENQLQWDAGLFVPATLGDYVWTDDNADGIQATSETGTTCRTGVTVKLTNFSGAAVKDVNGVTVADQVTTNTGKYLFTNLLPGNYVVTFVPALNSGCIFTTKDNSTTTDLLDSDADTSNGKTTTISLAAGDNQLQWDAGLYIPAQLGDYVWTDTNADGVQNTTETDTVCREGVIVKLTDASGNTVKDASGVTVASQVTGSTGMYLFKNLVPGIYKVVFVAASGSHCIITKMDSGASDTLDSDADMTTGVTTSITLVSGDKQLQWDAGLVQSACIGDRIFEDLNANGVEDSGEPGIPNAVVTLHMPDGTLVDQTSDLTGTYGFCNLFPTTYTVSIIKTQTAIVKFPDFGIGYTSTTPDTVTKTLAPNDYYKQADFGYLPYSKIGDQVFVDKNKDCKFDSVDTPVAGVKLNLKDLTGKVLQTTTTDAKGIYSFIVPSNLGYTVEVDDSWKQNSKISSASPTCGLTKTSPTMSPNQFYPDLDFGFINPELPNTGAPSLPIQIIGVFRNFLF